MKKKELKEEIIRLNKLLKDKETTIKCMFNFAILVDSYSQHRHLFNGYDISSERDIKEYFFDNEIVRKAGAIRMYLDLQLKSLETIRLDLLSDDIVRDFKDAIKRL